MPSPPAPLPVRGRGETGIACSPLPRTGRGAGGEGAPELPTNRGHAVLARGDGDAVGVEEALVLLGAIHLDVIADPDGGAVIAAAQLDRLGAVAGGDDDLGRLRREIDGHHIALGVVIVAASAVGVLGLLALLLGLRLHVLALPVAGRLDRRIGLTIRGRTGP